MQPPHSQSRHDPVAAAHQQLRHSGAVGLPPAANLPQHQTKVFIERPGGYLSSDVFQQRVEQQSAVRNLLESALDIVGFASDYDAKEYEAFAASVIDYLRRLADLLGGFAAGLSAFMLLAVYVDRDASSSEFFLMVYSTYYHSTQKIFMIISVFLIVLMLAPMAFELAMKSPNRAFLVGRRPDGTSELAPTIRDVLQSSSSSPYRYLVNIRFVMYVAALLATIVITSVEQNRNADQVRALSSSEVSRLHAGIIVRGALHILALIFQLANPQSPVVAQAPTSAAHSSAQPGAFSSPAHLASKP